MRYRTLKILRARSLVRKRRNRAIRWMRYFLISLIAILLALGGWTLQRTFSLSQDMVLIKTKVDMIEDEVSNFKDSKGKKNRKRKKKQDN